MSVKRKLLMDETSHRRSRYTRIHLAPTPAVLHSHRARLLPTLDLSLESMVSLPSNFPAGGLPDADNTAAGATLASARGPRSFLAHRKRLQDAVCAKNGDDGDSFLSDARAARVAAELTRVRRWSTSSDLLAVETMHNLTSAPRMLVGGRTVFLNPTHKRIEQLESLRSDNGLLLNEHRPWHRPTTSAAVWPARADQTRNPPLPEGSSGRVSFPGVESKSWKQQDTSAAPLFRGDTSSPEAATPTAPLDAFPRHITRAKSLQLPFAAIQAISRMGGLPASSPLKPRPLTTLAATRLQRVSSTSSAGASSIIEDARPLRARSFSVADAISPHSVTSPPNSVTKQRDFQKSVTRQKSVRTFFPSSRFGDPSDWKRGASWAQLIEQSKSPSIHPEAVVRLQSEQSSDPRAKAAGGVAGTAVGEQSHEVHVGPPASHHRSSWPSGCSDGGDNAVFQPVKLTW